MNEVLACLLVCLEGASGEDLRVQEIAQSTGSISISIKHFCGLGVGGKGEQKNILRRKVKNYMQSTQKFAIFTIFMLKLSNLV